MSAKRRVRICVRKDLAHIVLGCIRVQRDKKGSAQHAHHHKVIGKGPSHSNRESPPSDLHA